MKGGEYAFLFLVANLYLNTLEPYYKLPIMVTRAGSTLPKTDRINQLHDHNFDSTQYY